MSDFDSCQSNHTHMDGLHNWKANQVVQDLLWHLTLAYMKCVYGCAGVCYVITKFSQMDSLPNFVTHGAPLPVLRAREWELRYKEASSFKRMLDSLSSSTWKCSHGIRQFSHLFIDWKGPHDNKTQNTHVLNSQASLGTSGNKMADKLWGLQVPCCSFDQFYSQVVHHQDEG